MIDIRKIDNCKEAIKTMCNNCKNHDMCMGTGCTPKNTLLHLMGMTESLNDALLYACEILSQDMQKVETQDGDITSIHDNKENWYKWLVELEKDDH